MKNHLSQSLNPFTMITEQTMYKAPDGTLHETKTEALLHHIGTLLKDERYEYPMDILCFLEDLSDNPALLKSVRELIKATAKH